jgi:hypothetical protein
MFVLQQTHSAAGQFSQKMSYGIAMMHALLYQA